MSAFFDRVDALDPAALAVFALVALGVVGLFFLVAWRLDRIKHRRPW
jgi:hypothetical protein